MIGKEQLSREPWVDYQLLPMFGNFSTVMIENSADCQGTMMTIRHGIDEDDVIVTLQSEQSSRPNVTIVG
jgi:hypothetical protein